MMQRRDDQVITKGLHVVQNQARAAQKCPRCDSLNTKFCYYNNYSLSQPRYLCKTCRRYWTQGGTLRNVPIGGGSRKAKRPKLSSSDNSKSQQPPLPPLSLPPQVLPSSLTTSPQHVVFSGTPIITTSSFFNLSGDQLGSSSSWINSFGSSIQEQCQIQAPETLFEMTDQSSRKAAVTSSSPAGWPESYINNPISNPMTAAGDAVLWTAGNPTNNGGSVNQWPDYMAGFCPPP